MDVALNLVVIRSPDLERSRRFYEGLGLQFSCERHGGGPEHLAARLGETVFEIYSLDNGPPTTGVRLGFRVASIVATVSSVAQHGGVLEKPARPGPWGIRAVVVDPDGHRVELSQATGAQS